LVGVTVSCAVSLSPHNVAITSKQPVCSELYVLAVHMPPASVALQIVQVAISVTSQVQPNTLLVAVAVNFFKLPASILHTAGVTLMLVGQVGGVTVRTQVLVLLNVTPIPITVKVPHVIGVILLPEPVPEPTHVWLAPAPLMVKLTTVATPSSLLQLSYDLAVYVTVVLTAVLFGHGERTMEASAPGVTLREVEFLDATPVAAKFSTYVPFAQSSRFVKFATPLASVVAVVVLPVLNVFPVGPDAIDAVTVTPESP
jgi:hypothetical protein